MTGTTHALVGAAIGAKLRHPVKAFAGGILAHALLDWLPHRDYPRPWLLADAFSALAVLAYGASKKHRTMLLGAVGCMLPDFESLAGDSNPHPRPKLFPSHWFRHDHHSIALGLAVELVTAALAVLITTSQSAGELR